MLWSRQKVYYEEPFELEKDLERAILHVRDALFGRERIYLDLKKKMGAKHRVANIPDGYLIDLSSKKEPKLYIVENELIKHEPLKHVAVQILEFSLSFENSRLKIKRYLKERLTAEEALHRKCHEYAEKNGFENIDVLLEMILYGENKFNVLVIIDEVSEELETALIKRFKFPVEIVTLQRYRNAEGDRLYQFEPFLYDIQVDGGGRIKPIDPSEIDTVVVPAHIDGFEETFIGENCWYAIRMHTSMLPKIKYIATYQVAPISAITHVAEVESIERWKDSNKYIVRFAGPPAKIGPIKLVPKGAVKALQNIRYTSIERLKKAKTLDEAF